MPPNKRLSPPSPSTDSTDHRQRLTALRDRLTTELETASSAYVAGIARQLQSVLNELAQLRVSGPGSEIDNLRAKREDRIAAATKRAPSG